MYKKKLLVMASGDGTNFQAIIDACENGSLPCSIELMCYNKVECGAQKRAQNHGIPSVYFPWIKTKQSRQEYDKDLALFINRHTVDCIVLAGWMHLFSKDFLNNIIVPIINLHPAYPGEFPGTRAIEQAWSAFQEGKIKETGIMVHYVVEEVDAGEVIKKTRIPIFDQDTLVLLTNRIRTHEKYLLVRAIEKLVCQGKLNRVIYSGKVRDIIEVDNNKLILNHSDRQSAFDRHICNIPHKGTILTNISRWWFERTSHIIPNHYISSNKNMMLVKNCVPFRIEVIVRGYITGSTSTSLWTHYQKGVRSYCGHHIRDGYIKNQKLDFTIVTPTTKGNTDELISGSDIIRLKIMNEKQWSYCHDKAIELFEFGQKVARERGLILVDTKYEFGYCDNDIYLIDELHTVDSSRYWLLSTYHDKLSNGLEPDKYDKDLIREWVKARCDPYNEKLPQIPQELIDTVSNSYHDFYKKLTGINLMV
jgi:phosphoribosylaminoimidazole-succinocarboxamide synthase